MKRSQYKEVCYHVMGCIAFIALPLVFYPHPPEDAGFLFSPPTIRDLTGNVLMLLFFYLNYYLLIPEIYFKHRHIVYFICVTAGLVIICTLPSLLTGYSTVQRPAGEADGMLHNHLSIPVEPSDSSFFQKIGHHIFLYIAVILFSLLLRTRSRWFETETARKNAELSYLKAQINPHFLFNTLNSIYALAIQQDEKTADAIVQLSELMRYIIKDAPGNAVALENEIRYIASYVWLQQARLGDTATIAYQAEGATNGRQIAPLILISFIENAFKHGINPDEASTIRISINITGKTLRLVVFNTKVKTVNHEAGIGLYNATKRLQLLYPFRHTLAISDREDSYTVELLMILS